MLKSYPPPSETIPCQKEQSYFIQKDKVEYTEYFFIWRPVPQKKQESTAEKLSCWRERTKGRAKELNSADFTLMCLGNHEIWTYATIYFYLE